MALGVVVGMLLAGFVLPLASSEPDAAGSGATPFAADSPRDEAAPAAGEESVPADGPQPAVETPAEATETDADGLTAEVAEQSRAGADEAVSEGTGQVPERSEEGERRAEAEEAEVERTASEEGVTPETVELGVALVDLDALSATGVAASNGTTEDREKAWEALVEHANEQGGAAGRTIELFVEAFDPLDQGDDMQACRRLTEDEQVFNIITDTGWSEEAVLCVTREHGLVDLGYDSHDLSVFEQAGGLFWTTLASTQRIVYNDAIVLHERGLLEGRTLGLVSIEGSREAIEEVAFPMLDRLGYTVEHESTLSSDPSTAQSQIPVEINQMRSKGVDFIIFYGGPVNSNFWLNQAQKQNYHPTYSFSDFSSGADSFSVQSVEQQIDAHVFGTRRKYQLAGGFPPADSDEECAERIRQRTDLEISPEDDIYYETTRYCRQLEAFIDATDAAGPNPTREGFAAAVANMGQRPHATVGPPGVGGSWLPDKPGAADYLLEMHHEVECRCWVPETDDWFPMRRLGE